MTNSSQTMIKEFYLENLAACQKLAGHFAPLLRVGDIITFVGNLGAGKTEFCRSIIHALGFNEDVPSPTFNIVQVYEPAIDDNEKACIWHVDLYRLEEPEEVFELGLQDAFDEAITLVEWPDKMGRYLPDGYLQVNLDFADADGARNIVFSGNQYWTARLQELEL